MDVDSVDSVEGSADFFDSDEITSTLDKPLWFGREVQLSTEKNQKLELLAQFFFANLQRMEEILNLESGADRFHLLDLYDEVEEEISANFDQYADFAYLTALYHPLNQEFTFLDPKDYQTDIVQCKSLFGKVLKYSGFMPSGGLSKIRAKAEKKAAKLAAKAAKETAKCVQKVAKETVHFVEEHKTEILVVSAVLAVAVGGYLIGGALAKTAAGVAAAGIGATQGATRRRDNDKVSEPDDIEGAPPPKDPLPLSSFLSEKEKAYIEKSNPLSGLNASASPPRSTSQPNISSPFQNGISSTEFLGRNSGGKSNQPINGMNAGPNSPFNMPEHHNEVPLQSVISGFLEKVAHGVCNTVAATRPYIPDALIEPYTRSCRVETEGIEYSFMRIGFINGMNNSYEECMSNLGHIKAFVGDMKVEGVYNHSNGIGGDLAEVFLLNYGGVAPVTAKLLIENWTRFHEENKDNPDAKYLQFTHSMGTILTKDALQKIPKEIRDRVIVVAIGPAIVIPENLCYGADHYASKEDIVHLGENLSTFAGASLLDDAERAEVFRRFEENKNRLILLDPHPNYEGGIDHGFQSPTFDEPLEKHTKEYLERNGQYQ